MEPVGVRRVQSVELVLQIDYDESCALCETANETC